MIRDYLSYSTYSTIHGAFLFVDTLHNGHGCLECQTNPSSVCVFIDTMSLFQDSLFLPHVQFSYQIRRVFHQSLILYNSLLQKKLVKLLYNTMERFSRKYYEEPPSNHNRIPCETFTCPILQPKVGTRLDYVRSKLHLSKSRV